MRFSILSRHCSIHHGLACFFIAYYALAVSSILFNSPRPESLAAVADRLHSQQPAVTRPGPPSLAPARVTRSHSPRPESLAAGRDGSNSPQAAVTRSGPPQSPRPESLAVARLSLMVVRPAFTCRGPTPASLTRTRYSLILSDSPPPRPETRSLRHGSDLKHPDLHL